MKEIKHSKEYFMRAALKEAMKAQAIDEVPIGAVVVKDNIIIARAHNLKEKNQLATSHAEILAIQKAEKKLKTWNLMDCELYVTLEPCMMCTGAIYFSRVGKLIYGTKDPKGGAVDSLIQVKTIPYIKSWPREIEMGILQEECASILTNYFKEKRRLKKLEKSQ